MISVEYAQSIDGEGLLVRMFPSFDQGMISQYAQKVGLIIERFEITHGENTYSILKNHRDIQDFILAYNMRFKASLVFGKFMSQGIKEVFTNQSALSWTQTISFFQIKDLEFRKTKSIRVLKKCGGRYNEKCCSKLRFFWQWKHRDFVIDKNGLFYYKVLQGKKQIKEYIPFNKSFSFFYGSKTTDYQFGVRIEASHRKLLLYFEEEKEFVSFIYFIQMALQEIENAEQYRFSSFSPVRLRNSFQFYIDGEDYFAAVGRQIDNAQMQVLICGWWISPEFQLIRPVSQYGGFRLDSLLQRIARRGVEVFILVYNQSSFLTNDSNYTKSALQSLHPGIKVLRHPLGILPTFWSHHEKAVIIDQQIAFLGGLDLCYARYDTRSHSMDNNSEDIYPGIEYNNIRIRDLTNVKDYQRDSLPRSEPRLPWHDVCVKMVGEGTHDVVQHFVEYWNYASFQSHYQQRYVLIVKGRHKETKLAKLQKKISQKFQQIKQFAVNIKSKIFSSPVTDEVQSDLPSIPNEDKPPNVVPHLVNPSQQTEKGKAKGRHLKYYNNIHMSDQHIVTIQSDSSKKSQLSSVDRLQKMRSISKLKEDSVQFQSGRYNSFQGKPYSNLIELDQIIQEIEDEIEGIPFIPQIEGSSTHKIPRMSIVSENQLAMENELNGECQVVRSASNWSMGCKQSCKQISVQRAYIELIRQANHFIYIENQFMISSTQGTGTVKNAVVEALFNRIERAIKEAKPFYVFVLLPLVPGFAGELDDPDAVLPRIIMHWQYQTIVRSNTSLLSKIAVLGVDPSNYIFFFGLRTHAVINQQPRTEIIYVHSKLLIVDDYHAICGSANINDRSMQGSRDSQLCLVLSGGNSRNIRIGECQVSVSEQIHRLRKELFMENFGLSSQEAANPLNEMTLAKIKRVAGINTVLYRQAFGCYPDDNIKQLHQIELAKKEPTHQKYALLIECVVGNAVEYPLLFLEEQDLLEGATLYPTIVST